MEMYDYKKQLPIKSITLKNGLNVIVAQKKNIPVVSINLGYKVGSVSEKRGRTGMAHLFEHLMFEGTSNLQKGEFDRLCSLAGGTNNAYTSYDHTAFTMTLPAHQLELGLWLEADRMQNFLVTEEALEIQKKVVIEEILQVVDNQPYGRWREIMSAQAFSAIHPYSWEVHGRREDVASVEMEDINAFHAKFYRPQNATLVICGNVDPDITFKLVEQHFGNIENEINNEKLKNVRGKSFKKVWAEFYDTVPSTAVFLSYHCPSFVDDTIFSSDIIANVMGGGKSSRLYNSLVYKKQIASFTGAFADKRRESSLITLYAVATEPETTANALADALYEEIFKLSTEGISTKEFDKAINKLTTQIGYEFQYSSSLADIISSQAMFWNMPERVYQLLDRYKSLTIADLKEFVKLHLSFNDCVRVDVIPKIHV